MDHERDLKINLIFSHLLAPLNVSKFRPTPTKMGNTFIGLFCVLGNLEHFIFFFPNKIINYASGTDFLPWYRLPASRFKCKM